VYRSRGTYAASAKFTTWLYRIATNLAVNYARDTRHERPEHSVSLDEPNAETGTTLGFGGLGRPMPKRTCFVGSAWLPSAITFEACLNAKGWR